MRAGATLVLCVALAAAPAFAAQDIEFDVSAFEKKPFEWWGYGEFKPEAQRLDRSSAGYALQFPGESRSTLTRWSVAAELSGVYRHDDFRAHFTGHASYLDDPRERGDDSRLFEAYGAWQPGPRAALEAGKRTLRWGKGYAWNPVAFFERSRDPTDPELSREGFVMLTGDLTRSLGGTVQTVGFTPVLLPVTGSVNQDYGPDGHTNPAAKLYALVHDTDVDLIYAASGSRGARWGADFSRNLGSNLEIHGEWARINAAPRAVLTPTNAVVMETRDSTSWLLGLRYLSERETTVIAEYYRNGGGYTEDELRRFFELVRAAAGNPALRRIASQAASGGYTRPNPMRDYVYLRVSQKEPFDILYFTPAVTAIVNADDGSYTVIPELVYTGFTNVELRLRAQWNLGGRLTEYGEKVVDSRVELRARLFF